MRRLVLVSLVLLVAVSAAAGTISSLSPSSFVNRSGEHFITINGSSLGNTVRFSGPAGTFSVDINARITGGVIAWLPLEILNTPGTYSLTVTGGALGDSGPASFTVTKTGGNRLTLHLPDSIVLQAFTREGRDVKYDISALGGEDPQPVVSCDWQSGSVFKLGKTDVNCIATNSLGERDAGSFSVVVFDGDVPTLTLPKEVVVEEKDPRGTVVTFDTKADDVIEGGLAVSCSPASGSLFRVGYTNVRCTATDGWNNTGYGAFNVLVRGEERLIINAPDVVAEAENSKGANVTYAVEAYGTSDPEPTVSCSQDSGTFFELGKTEVRCSAKDSNGNSAEASFLVYVNDTTGPLIRSIAPSPDRLLGTSGRMIPVEVKIDASDVVDATARCSILGVTSNEKISLEDYKVTGELSLDVREWRDGEDRLYSIEVQCSDSNGNLSRDTGHVRVTDEKTQLDKPAEPETPAPSVGRRRPSGRG